jgi:uncharacterized membrane protein YdbT with pleckstrin-like domain
VAFVKRHLMPGEELLYLTRKHWKIFFLPVLLMVFGLLFLALFLSSQPMKPFLYIGSALGVVAFLLFIPPLVEYLGAEFAVTNRRVLINVGLVRRHSVEVLLNRLEGVQVDQGVMGRILNYGAILVSGTGGTRESFQDVARPMEFRQRVQQSMASSGTPAQ